MEKYEKLNINDLVLWKDNARYSKTLDSEEACLRELFGDKNTNQKQKVLLNDIFLETNVIENCIVYKEEINEGEFQLVVLDGNRRISLFKIFNYPELIKEYGLDYVKLQHINEKITNVDCKIYTVLDDAYKHVELRHLDEQKGKGTVKWASENKVRMLEIQNKEINSIGYKILKFYESTNKPEFQEVKAKVKDKSTLDRIFGYKNTYSKIFGLSSKHSYDIYNSEHQLKINDVLKKFYSIDGNVTDVYTAAKTKELLSDVEALQNNKNQLNLDTVINNTDNKNDVTPKPSGAHSRTPNRYTINGANLFDWKSKGIKSNNDLFKYYLNKLVEIKVSSDFDKDLILDIAPYFYRLLLDIAFAEISEYITKNNTDKYLISGFDKAPFNTTAKGMSCVNSNKIIGILTICDSLRRNEDKKIFATYKSNLNVYHFTTSNVSIISKFVQDLNDVVHGSSKTLSPQTLEKYDQITITLIQIVYTFINCK